MTEKHYTAAFYTLGCRVNQYETRAVEELFLQNGFTVLPFDRKCDVYVINTCTVTAESDRKSRQFIRRARKTGGKEAVIIVMGCMTAVDRTNAAKALGADYVCGNDNKCIALNAALALLKKKPAPALPATGSHRVDMKITGSDNIRAFLKIADGCENHCAYCIIPTARGSIVSKDPSAVCDEVETLVKNGYNEVVLTGIETAAYGKDLPDYDLVSLMENVDGLKNAPTRLRLGSLEPSVLKKERITRLAACRHLMPHYHLSLQSGCDAVLRGMRRKYNTAMFLEVVRNLRAAIPLVTFTTDIIVGFPGETEEMYRETEEFVRTCGFLYVHIFPYSDRAGTDASAMDGKLSEQVKKDRAARLKAVMLETRRGVLEGFVGTVQPILIETVEHGIATGHSPHFIETKFDVSAYPDLVPNTFVDVLFERPSENAEYMLSHVTHACERTSS